jgi:hypothetical protein
MVVVVAVAAAAAVVIVVEFGMCIVVEFGDKDGDEKVKFLDMVNKEQFYNKCCVNET